LAPGGSIQPPSAGVPSVPSILSGGIFGNILRIFFNSFGLHNIYLSGSPFTKINDEPISSDEYDIDISMLDPGKEYSIVVTSVDEFDQESAPSDSYTFIFGTPTVTITQTATNTFTPTISLTETESATGTSTNTPTSTETGTDFISYTPTVTETITETSTYETATLTITQTGTDTDTMTFTTTPTSTATSTVTATSTATMGITLLFKSGDTNINSNSPHPMFRLINNDTRALDLSKIEIRYWYIYEGTGQQETIILDYAGIMPSGTNIQNFTHLQIISNLTPDNSARYLKATFDQGAGSLLTSNYADINTRFNKTDWSAYDQSNDWSYTSSADYIPWNNVVVYYNGTRIWGNEPAMPSPTNTITVTSSPVETATVTCTPFIDNFEPDDTYTNAASINNGDTQIHSINPAGDIDWIKFDVNQLSEVVIQTSGDTSVYNDTVIYLYDSNGVINDQMITMDDDGGDEFFSKIDTILNPGSYYVKITAYDDTEVINSYNVSLNINPVPTGTPSITATLTNTITPTEMDSMTNTLTQTFTLTNTPTQTSKPADTTTQTITQTVTGTSTVTATYTITYTMTSTATSSVTPSITLTETPTTTTTSTVTLTATPTITRTITRTYTPTWTPTATFTITTTYMATPSLTCSATGSNTASPVVSPTNTLTITPTQGQLPANVTLMYKAADTNNSTNSPHPQFRLYNNDSNALALSRVEIRYWYKFEGTSQSEQTSLDYAGRLPSGTNIQSTTHLAIITGSFGDQDRYLSVTFDSGAGNLAQNNYAEIQTRFNKLDWSSYTQSNDWSYTNYTSFTNWNNVTVYVDGTLVWGTSPGSGVLSISKKETPQIQKAEPLSEQSVYNYPNPFSGDTTIRFSVDSISDVQIAIYDINDKPVWFKRLEASEIHEGVNYLKWDSTNNEGTRVSNGVYLLEITAGDKSASKTIVVIR
jgi:hypothetical protein